jgi:hypothetical protein
VKAAIISFWTPTRSGWFSSVQTVSDLSSESAELAGEQPESRAVVAATRVIAVASCVMRDFFIATPL